MPISMLIPVAASVGCILFAVYFLRAYKRADYHCAFWLKGGAALCFVLLGSALLLPAENKTYARLLVAGLLLGLCGDELLALRFLVPKLHDFFFGIGAAAFATGHFFYMKALYDLGCIRLVSLLPVLGLGLLAAFLYGKHQGSNAGSLQIAGVLYMALVVFMGSVAISAAIHAPGPGLLLFALGGICFGLSDNILFAYSYGKNRTWGMNVWVHITYYAAQLLIGWSILFVA